jgi:hypothetical protein
MAITSWDGWVAAPKQRVIIQKTASITAAGAQWTSIWHLAGSPGPGTLAVGNTTSGVVPTDATAGFPVVNAFQAGGGILGYVGSAKYRSSVPGSAILHDRLFHAGAFAFNFNGSLTGQPSFASRLPGGNDYTGTELWLEAVTAFIGNLSIAVTYTNQDGVTGRSTGTVALGFAPIVARLSQLPLQAGDTGIQRIDSIVATGATAGTFNLFIARPLAEFDIRVANAQDTQGIDIVGMPVVTADACLSLMVAPDGIATGTPRVVFNIVNG